jgi:L-threonylcarbamoyladenylate synthase
MLTQVLAVDPLHPQGEAIAQAAAVLRRGGLVAFPTETVYGLGAHALDAQAVAGIFQAKGRPAGNPLIVHVAAAEDILQVAADWAQLAGRLAQRFWPGPLTLVVPRGPGVPDVVTAGGPTVAVRVPAHPVALALLEAAGVPVAAPSANRSGLLSPTLAEHVLLGLDGRIDMVLDGGPTPGGVESTVLDVTTSPPRLLRPGLISRGDLEAVIGPVVDLHQGLQPATEPLRSPGLLTRHYAPRTPLECVEGCARARVEQLVQTGLSVAWLTAQPSGLPAGLGGVLLWPMPADAAGWAARLYRDLHQLDALGLDRIVVELPPDTVEWQAIRDRLLRAATP